MNKLDLIDQIESLICCVDDSMGSLDNVQFDRYEVQRTFNLASDQCNSFVNTLRKLRQQLQAQVKKESI